MPLEEYTSFFCPYCAAENSLAVDLSAGRRQSFVVDCEACCAPITLNLSLADNGEISSLTVRRENE